MSASPTAITPQANIAVPIAVSYERHRTDLSKCVADVKTKNIAVAIFKVIAAVTVITIVAAIIGWTAAILSPLLAFGLIVVAALVSVVVIGIVCMKTADYEKAMNNLTTAFEQLLAEQAGQINQEKLKVLEDYGKHYKHLDFSSLGRLQLGHKATDLLSSVMNKQVFLEKTSTSRRQYANITDKEHESGVQIFIINCRLWEHKNNRPLLLTTNDFILLNGRLAFFIQYSNETFGLNIDSIKDKLLDILTFLDKELIDRVALREYCRETQEPSDVELITAKYNSMCEKYQGLIAAARRNVRALKTIPLSPWNILAQCRTIIGRAQSKLSIEQEIDQLLGIIPPKTPPYPTRLWSETDFTAILSRCTNLERIDFGSTLNTGFRDIANRFYETNRDRKKPIILIPLGG